MSFSLLATALFSRVADGSLLPPVVAYIGPGVAVPVLTGLAAALGFVMLAWDRTAGLVRRLLRRGKPASSPTSSKEETEA